MLTNQPVHSSAATGPSSRRQLSDEVVDGIAVRKALADFLGHVGRLQHRAVLVRALTVKSRGAATEDALAALVRDVEQTRADFEALVQTLPARQRQHSRVFDLDRSLRALEASFPAG